MTGACTDNPGRQLLPTPADAAARRLVDEPVCVRIGPVDIELRSVLPEAAEDFAFLYRTWRRIGPTAPKTIHMEVRASGKTPWRRKRFSVIGDGEELFSDLRREEVLPYIEWGINYRVMGACAEYLQLHAATLAHEGRGVMLVGDSGCGKSTLAAVLAARGWGYLGDEFALIDPRTFYLHPFPKALCIKAGSFPLIRRLGMPLCRRRPYVKVFKGQVGYVSPHEVHAESGAFPIRLIVFPRYTGGARPRLYPVSGADAAFSLAANAFNRSLFGDGILSALGTIVRGARCVVLEPGEIEETTELIESLVSHGPQPP